MRQTCGWGSIARIEPGDNLLQPAEIALDRRIEPRRHEDTKGRQKKEEEYFSILFCISSWPRAFLVKNPD
jgi:hypothetical protein